MNELSKETSPYLLQHANNPVHWVAWNKETLEQAKILDKPIIISIGYSACHWCHVMEHESFENEEVAAIMNEYFVCIKVDREERPDVDAIYMDAVQAMGIRGGWPLNVFLMPNGKPFYGGTYFPAEKWAGLCQNIHEAFLNNRSELESSSEGFTHNMKVSETDKYGLNEHSVSMQWSDIELITNGLIKYVDPVWGGMSKAPKFPMPSIWHFLLLVLASSTENEAKIELEQAVKNTLNRMAMGGIFDQLAGGFARYSVDGEWFCPHFEKMLYDNAQLLSLYAKGYKFSKSELYKEVITQTVSWLKTEMKTDDGGFYSAQDADSEGVEGKFYVWEKEEIIKILGDDYVAFCKAYQVTENGNWEEETNILWKNKPFLNDEFASEIEKLLKVRSKRIFPGLDDKILCSWNALMVSGLVDAYKSTQISDYQVLAMQCGDFIKNNFYKNGKLFRTYKNGFAKIDGFLEDYATVIEAYIALYQVTFNENWLSLAESLTITCLVDFYDEKEQFFNFSSKNGEQLIANKIELFDNVIPASNSIMANSLFDLGVLLSKNEFIALSNKMVTKMRPLILKNGEYLSNWARLAVKILNKKIEIVVYGSQSDDFSKDLLHFDLPDYYILASKKESTLPMFANRWPNNNDTLIYVCVDNACLLPVKSVLEAVNLIKQI